jgi:hypothetical protein
MYKPLNKAGKRLAQAAVLTLAITGISAPSFAETETAMSTFTIEINQFTDPCAGELEAAASWSPEEYVTLSEVNSANTNNPGSILVDPGASVTMTVGLGFRDGEDCYLPVDPDGTVIASWTMPGSGDVTLDGFETCVLGATPCSAADTNSISATALVSPTAPYGAINSGHVDIEWIPANSTTP